MTITTSTGSIVASSGESFALSSLFSIPSGYSQIKLQIVDDNNYALANPGNGGYVSGNGLQSVFNYASGTDITAYAIFTYDTSVGDYVDQGGLGSLSALSYVAASGVNHGEMISIFTPTASGGWSDAADLYVVVQSSAATTSAATPQNLCAIAETYVGQTWNNDGCWLLTADIAARAGASLPLTSAYYSTLTNPAAPRANGEWIVVYNANTQSNPTLAEAEAMLQPGDVLSFAWQGDKVGHSLTVVSGYGANALTIDNSGPAATDGSASDIVIQAAHSLAAEWGGQGGSSIADATTIQIYRLDTPTITIANPRDSVPLGQSVILATLTSAQDAGGAGHLPITAYAFYDVHADGSAGDSFDITGSTPHEAGTASAPLVVSAASAASVFLEENAATTDIVYVRAFNGSYWGDWASFAVTFAPTKTATAAVTQFQAGALKAPVIVTDSAAAVTASLDALQALAAGGDLASITLTDSGAPSLSLTAKQVGADSGVLSAIAGNHSLTVTDSAADISANFAALQSFAAAGLLTAITVTDGAAVPLSLTVGEVVSDKAAVALLASGISVAVTDSAADVAASLDALQALAASGRLSSITLTDAGTPLLPVSAAQLVSDAQALKLISSAYQPVVDTTLASFGVTGANGLYSGLVADSAGNLYGDTYGGTSGLGSIFEIAKTANGYASSAASLFTFTQATGTNARGDLSSVAGTIYGTTQKGGLGNGTVFVIAAGASAANGPTSVIDFNGADGDQPYANVITDANGDLFGTTSAGGAGAKGTVFEIIKGASGYAPAPTDLVAFTGSDGQNPYGGLAMDANGDLIGTTNGGGAANDGTLFELVKTALGYASVPTTLISFDGANGSNPHGSPVVDAKGDLFGVTMNGGASGDGTVFELVKTASGYASAPITLVSFNGADGSSIENVTLDAHGNLFGVAFYGGANDQGVVFEVAKTPSGYAATPAILLSFDVANGLYPHGDLLIDAAGNLLGTTEGDGTQSGGAVFELSGVAAVGMSAATALKSGQSVQHMEISDLAATVQADLDGLQSLAAAGRVAGIDLTANGTPTISITALQSAEDATALQAINGSFDLTIIAGTSSQAIVGLAGHGAIAIFTGAADQYTITPTGDGTSFVIGNGLLSDHVSTVTALQFSDLTDFVVSQTPAPQGGVSSFQVTTLYAAVLDREPDVAGLALYESAAAANPSVPITTFAEYFLNSAEYTGNSKHHYAQTAAGDAQFINDLYENLLHRAPETGAVAFYQDNVITPMLANLTPGTTAYADAELLAHATVLSYFSLSAEFKSDVEVTAQTPSSLQHWLVLI